MGRRPRAVGRSEKEEEEWEEEVWQQAQWNVRWEESGGGGAKGERDNSSESLSCQGKSFRVSAVVPSFQFRSLSSSTGRTYENTRKARDERRSSLVSKFVLNFLLVQSTVDLFAAACPPISLGVGGGGTAHSLSQEGRVEETKRRQRDQIRKKWMQ